MNTRRLFTALLFALLCSGLLTWLLSRQIPHAPQPARVVASRKHVVALKNIQTGEPLDAASLTTVNWPVDQQIMGTFSDPRELIGRIPSIPIPSGDLILAHDLTPFDAGIGLCSSIPAGMRAVSVRAPDEAETVAGLIVPGSHVDVLVTYRSEADSTFVSSMVLQDICVLPVGKKENPGTEKQFRSEDTVTLLVTPEAAARFAVAASLGKITFALRSSADTSLSSGLAHVTLTPVAQVAPKVPTFPTAQRIRSSQGSAPRGFVVETLTGGKSTAQTFQENQP